MDRNQTSGIRVSVVTSYSNYLQNRLFSDDRCLTGAHSDNKTWLEPYQHLYKDGASKNIEFGTSDILKPENADVVLFLDLPSDRKQISVLRERAPKAKFVLILIESPMQKNFAFDPANHAEFDAVITYNRKLIDNRKYFPYRLPVGYLPENKEEISFSNRKTAVLVSTNQNYGFRRRVHQIRRARKQGWSYPLRRKLETLFFPRELYSARRKLVETFETMSSGELDVFGTNWESSPSWRGVLTQDKLKALGKYRFNICFENHMNNIGYVSEKIFDSLFSGSVPVYMGELSISKIVPPEAFVDWRHFKNPEELVAFLLSCKESEWENYRKAGKEFISGSAVTEFLPEAFSKSISNVIDYVCSK